MNRSMKTTGRLAALAGILFSAIPAGAADLQIPDDGFRQIKPAPGLATGPTVIDVIRPFIDGFPEGAEGRQSAEIRIVGEADGYAVEMVLSGYLDDSVAGERYRGFVIPTADGWELLEMSVKPDCHRGEAVDGLCP